MNAPVTGVLFLDTGQHFATTLDFRRRVARSCLLRVVNVRWDDRPGRPTLAVPETANEF